MLAVSGVRNGNNDEKQGEIENFSIVGDHDFPDFDDDDTNLLDSIDFDDLFVGINDGDVLPDLEMDPELLAEFSLSAGEESEVNGLEKFDDNTNIIIANKLLEVEEDDHLEVVSKRDDESATQINEEAAANGPNNLVKLDGDKIKHHQKSSSSSQSKSSQGKRKVKVN